MKINLCRKMKSLILLLFSYLVWLTLVYQHLLWQKKHVHDMKMMLNNSTLTMFTKSHRRHKQNVMQQYSIYTFHQVTGSQCRYQIQLLFFGGVPGMTGVQLSTVICSALGYWATRALTSIRARVEYSHKNNKHNETVSHITVYKPRLTNTNVCPLIT